MPFNKHSALMAQNGFTLIEVMIAIIVLSFISFSTYKMVDSNSVTKDRVVAEDRQIVQTLTTIGRIDSDISQIYNPLFHTSKASATSNNSSNPYGDTSSAASNGMFDGRTKNGALIPQFKSEDKSSIIFMTESNRRRFADSKESRYSWVKYSLQNMPDDPDDPEKKNLGEYAMIRQAIPTDLFVTALNWDKSKPQIILENVKSLEFSFWNEKTKKYSTSIQELNENKNLIRSIKMNLVWVNSDKNEQTIEKTFRVLNPFFNTKLDDLKNGSMENGTPSPGGPTPPGDQEGGVVQ